MTTLSAYLQTWKLKLSNTKTRPAAFHLNNREAKPELNVYNNATYCSLSTPNLSWGKAGQVAFFPSPPQGFAQKTLHLSRAVRLVGSGWGAGAKTLRSTLLFPWSTPQLSTAHQFGVVVRILASLTAFSMILCALPLDACVSHQQRTCLSSQASSKLSSAN